MLCDELTRRYQEGDNYSGDACEGNCVHGGTEVVRDGETHVGQGSYDGGDDESGGGDGGKVEGEVLFVVVLDVYNLDVSDDTEEPILAEIS